MLFLDKRQWFHVYVVLAGRGRRTDHAWNQWRVASERQGRLPACLSHSREPILEPASSSQMTHECHLQGRSLQKEGASKSELVATETSQPQNFRAKAEALPDLLIFSSVPHRICHSKWIVAGLNYLAFENQIGHRSSLPQLLGSLWPTCPGRQTPDDNAQFRDIKCTSEESFMIVLIISHSSKPKRSGSSYRQKTKPNHMEVIEKRQRINESDVVKHLSQWVDGIRWWHL